MGARDECSRCGTDRDDRTQGCPTCRNRHHARRSRGTARPVVSLAALACIDCGAELDDHTAGCRACSRRHSGRDARRLRAGLARDSIQTVTYPPVVFPIGINWQTPRPTYLHDTGGIPGNVALDFMAPGGANVLAPERCKVIRLSGHDPATGTWANGRPNRSGDVFGWSCYLETPDGYVYFVTHLGKRALTVGRWLPAGALLGKVGHWPNNPGRSHAHIGVTSPRGRVSSTQRIRRVSAAPRVHMRPADGNV